MWPTRRAGPRPGSVAAALKNRNNAKNANNANSKITRSKRNANNAVKGAANSILREARNKASNEGNTKFVERIEKLRDSFDKLRLDSEKIIRESPYVDLNHIKDLATNIKKINPDERLPITSILELLKKGEIQNAIVQIIKGNTPDIEKGSNLDLFFEIYHNLIKRVQQIIKDNLKITGPEKGPQQGGFVEWVVVAALVTLIILIAVVSSNTTFTKFICKYRPFSDLRGCRQLQDKPAEAVPVVTENPFAVRAHEARIRANASRYRRGF